MRRLANALIFLTACTVAAFSLTLFPRGVLDLISPQKMGDTFVLEGDVRVTATAVETGDRLMTEASYGQDPRFLVGTTNVFLVVRVTVASHGMWGAGSLDGVVVSGEQSYEARESVVTPEAGFVVDGAFVIEVPPEALTGARLQVTQTSILIAHRDVPEFDLGLNETTVADLSLQGDVVIEPLPEQGVIP